MHAILSTTLRKYKLLVYPSNIGIYVYVEMKLKCMNSRKKEDNIKKMMSINHDANKINFCIL
jgi:hypothetical protein